MKKVVNLLLAFMVMIPLVGCGQSEAAKNVDSLISQIGTVTLQSEGVIISAEEALGSLSESDIKSVKNIAQLQEARNEFNTLVAKSIDEQIEAIGEITLDKKDLVTNARDAFDSLDSNIKNLVTKSSLLDDMDRQLNTLEAEVQGKEVDARICVMNVSLDNIAEIEDIKNAYDALSPEAKSFVPNAAAIEEALTTLQNMKRQQGEDILATMKADEDIFQKITFYYPSAWKWYDSNTWAADERCFILPYVGRQNDNVWLRCVYNYTGSDWVFYKKVYIVTDNNTYTKSFKYFDIVHDNSGGDVWEYIDDEVTSSDIEMFKDMANSSAVYVRFEGDDYAHDMQLLDKDKQALGDAVAVYEAFN